MCRLQWTHHLLWFYLCMLLKKKKKKEKKERNFWQKTLRHKHKIQNYLKQRNKYKYTDLRSHLTWDLRPEISPLRVFLCFLFLCFLLYSPSVEVCHTEKLFLWILFCSEMVLKVINTLCSWCKLSYSDTFIITSSYTSHSQSKHNKILRRVGSWELMKHCWWMSEYVTQAGKFTRVLLDLPLWFWCETQRYLW